MDSPPLNKRLAAEIVGTFGFLFIGFTSIAAGAPGPIGFGFGLFLMIAALGHISGGHFNPAVTVGLTVGGKHPAAEALQYIIAQLLGGVVAALLAILVYDGVGTFDKSNLVSSPGDGISSGKALILELIATALFLMVISAVATDKNAPWNGIQAPLGWLVQPGGVPRPRDHRGRLRRRVDLPRRPDARWCAGRRRLQVVPPVALTRG